MQIVIDIPDDVYERCRKYELHCGEAEVLEGAIANGTPLPKGHGRLFDERDIVNGNYDIIGNKIYEVEPIIEADKVESEELCAKYILK